MHEARWGGAAGRGSALGAVHQAGSPAGIQQGREEVTIHSRYIWMFTQLDGTTQAVRPSQHTLGRRAQLQQHSPRHREHQMVAQAVEETQLETLPRSFRGENSI